MESMVAAPKLDLPV